jgi:hypothetical protein
LPLNLADPLNAEIYGAVNGQYLVTALGSPTNVTSGIPDREYLTLIESSTNSRIFTGILGLSTDPMSNFGLLYINNQNPTTTASFVYTDPTGGSRTAVSKLQYQGVVTAIPSQGTSAIRAGDTILVTVTDGDADLNTLQIGEIQVTVSCPSDYTETLTLLEISRNSGVFTGAMATALGPAKSNQRIDVQMPSTSLSSSLALTVRLLE